MRPVVLLAQLNDLDLVVDGLKARLVEVTEALKEPAALQAVRQALAAAESELAQCRARQAEAEAVELKIAHKLTETEQRLYSGQVKNPKELTGAEQDVQQLRRQRSQAEDDLLAALMCAESATAAHMAAERTQARLSIEREAAVVTLRAEQATLTAKLTAAQARVTSVRRGVSGSLLPTYDALRSRRGGRAVAKLSGLTCSACRVAVSPGRKAVAFEGDELTYCENCGRLLWDE